MLEAIIIHDNYSLANKLVLGETLLSHTINALQKNNCDKIYVVGDKSEIFADTNVFFSEDETLITLNPEAVTIRLNSNQPLIFQIAFNQLLANKKAGDLIDLTQESALTIDSMEQLPDFLQQIQHDINIRHLKNGVYLVDPKRIDIGYHVKIEPDTTIFPNVTLLGKTVIGHDTVIKGNSWIENSTIGQHTTIDSSKIIDSTIADNTTIGPYAHIRQHSMIGQHVRIGNFVEVKKSSLGHHVSSAHLSYLGDSTIGNHVNIGCGVVTVNFDGANKYPTIIKDNAFIGCNANLIAPITIGEHAVVGAGSTLKEDVLDNELQIERAPLVRKAAGGIKYKQKKKGDKHG